MPDSDSKCCNDLNKTKIRVTTPLPLDLMVISAFAFASFVLALSSQHNTLHLLAKRAF